MSKNLRQIVSTMALDVKAKNLDDRKSFRYLADKFRDKLAYFLRLEARSREFAKDITVWKPINCVDLIDVPTNTCGYIDECNTLKRSEIKIPEAYSTNYGILLKVLTIDGMSTLTPVSSSQYASYSKIRYGGGNNYYWIENGYLYIPNVTWESVKVLILPKNPIEVDVINNPCECAYPLDGEVTVPDYLITLAQQEALKEIFQTAQLTEDERPNDNTNSKA